MNRSHDLTNTVKELAQRAGFARVGVAGAGVLAGEKVFRDWLARGWQGEMDYLARSVEKRFRPESLVSGARSVLCLAVGYAPAGGEPQPGPIALYARGMDYHKVLARRCRRLMDDLRALEGGFSGRAFVDSAPVAERSLAAEAGVGWIGRNGCLIAPALGSFVLLAEIVCNMELVPDKPLAPRCGDCDLCLRACPTTALAGDGLVDARRCISYLTIEHRGPIALELAPNLGCRVFGCDACQLACPFNRHTPAGDAELAASPTGLDHASLAEMLAWDEARWSAATEGTTLRRTGYANFLRNAAIAAENGKEG